MDQTEPFYEELGIGIGLGLKVVTTAGRCRVYPGRVVLDDARGTVVFDLPASQVVVRKQRFPGTGTYLEADGRSYFVRTALAVTARPGTAVAQLLQGRKNTSALAVAIQHAATLDAAESPPAEPSERTTLESLPTAPAGTTKPSPSLPTPSPDTSAEEPAAGPVDEDAAPADVDLQIGGLGPGRLVGAGGFGRVYLATHLGLDAPVAVKVLQFHPDERVRERFRRECQALGRLRGHPNIVTVFDEGFTRDGQPYLLMEYARGGTLSDRLAVSGPMRWAEAVDIVVKLSAAVETAHRAGLLHRDIKCANVLVSSYGEPQLADFGLSRFHEDEASRTSNLTLTMAYASPELIDGRSATAASDVYALAATLATLLRGRPPFYEDDDTGAIALIRRIANDPPPDVRSVGAPDDLAVALERGMAKDVSDRPDGALAFAELLRNVQRAHGIPVTPLSLPDQAEPEQSGEDGRTTILPRRTATVADGRTAITGRRPKAALAAGDGGQGADQGAARPPGPGRIEDAGEQSEDDDDEWTDWLATSAAPSSAGGRRRWAVAAAVAAVAVLVVGGLAMGPGGDDGPPSLDAADKQQWQIVDSSGLVGTAARVGRSLGDDLGPLTVEPGPGASELTTTRFSCSALDAGGRSIVRERLVALGADLDPADEDEDGAAPPDGTGAGPTSDLTAVLRAPTQEASGCVIIVGRDIGQQLNEGGTQVTHTTTTDPPSPCLVADGCYVLKAGDRLQDLEEVFDLDWRWVATYNRLGALGEDVVPAGQRVWKPSGAAPTLGSHTVVAGDTLRAIGTRYGIDWQDLFNYNPSLDPYRAPSVGQVLVIPRVTKRCSSASLVCRALEALTTSSTAPVTETTGR